MTNILPTKASLLLSVVLIASVLSGCKKELFSILVTKENGDLLELGLTREQIKYLFETFPDSVATVPVAERTFFHEEGDPNCAVDKGEEVYNRLYTPNFNGRYKDGDCGSAGANGTYLVKTLNTEYRTKNRPYTGRSLSL